MVQRGRSFGFPLETVEGLCVVGEYVGKELQRDVATELEVFRLVHHTHAPTADLAQDAVVGNRLPHRLGGRGHWLDMLGVSAGKVNVAILGREGETGFKADQSADRARTEASGDFTTSPMHLFQEMSAHFKFV